MKLKILTSILTLMLAISGAFAQGEMKEQFSIPLTSPGQPGVLEIETHDGTVTIVGYDGSEVQVTILSKGKDSNEAHNKYNKDGLKRIPNQALDVSIVEEDNHVRVKGENNKRTDFVIKVPKKFTLDISTHHNGDISVQDISGEIEANGHHGGITLKNVGGSIIADTHHGEIDVTLNSIYKDKPMAFTTYHGDVDVTFPASLSGNVKVKTNKGDFFTDFDISLEKQKSDTKTHEGRKEIKLSGWTYGKIGGGGPEMMFTTYHGDIVIRKG